MVRLRLAAYYGKTPKTYFLWGDEKSKFFTFYFTKINLIRKYQGREVLQQKDLGNFKDSFKINNLHHGVVTLQIFLPKKP